MGAEGLIISVNELLERLSYFRSKVIPLVGSGLLLNSGAPSDARLAELLRQRLQLPAAGTGEEGLLRTMNELEADRLPEAQHAVADIINCLLLRPTPELTTLVSVPSRRILTTNYDDGLERAAVARGLIPVTLTGNDPELLTEPDGHHVHIIHMHGVATRPETVVLPGRLTDQAAQQEPLQTLLRGRMSASPVLYTGFSFADSEAALASIVTWLTTNIKAPRPQWLLAPTGDLRSRPTFLSGLRSAGVIQAVGFDTSDGYADVERVALSLAPRASVDRRALTWVVPRLVDISTNDQEQLASKLLRWNLDADDSEHIFEFERIRAEDFTVVIAGPGMGKSTLLEKLVEQEHKQGRGAAFARLMDFATDSEEPERALGRLLRAQNGEPIGLDGLEGERQVLALDGLDEITDPVRREAAAEATAQAVERWGQHCWVVSTRPTATTDLLNTPGMRRLAIFPDRGWASAYLRTRGISDDRRTRASLEVHGLGDVLAIPLFAERIADRLLDGDGRLPDGPLALLVDEQRRAARREAHRRDVREEDLFGWLERVAVALELRGQTSAQPEEVSRISGSGDLSTSDRREMLAEAALLRDVPGEVAFTLRPMQQALCAAALLAGIDPLYALEQVAVADLDGRRCMRGDLGFTLDLFFEGAPTEVRSQLRELDEQRWARTTPTHASSDEAADALNALLAWHANRQIALVRMRDGLRSAEEAVTTLVGRWPKLVEEDIDEFLRALESDEVWARLQAMVVLGALPDDERAEGWLLPLIDDGDDRVAARACALAGRRGLRAAQPALLKQVVSRDEGRAGAALRALITVCDEEDLPEVLREATGTVRLRQVAREIRERVHDLDLAFRVLAAVPQPSEIWDWLLGRFIEDARIEAWTPDRVQQLVHSLNGRPGLGVDVEQVGRVLALHPRAALDAVRATTPLGNIPYVHHLVVRCIEAGCARELEEPGYEAVRLAVARDRAEDERRRQQHAPKDHSKQSLAEALERDGAGVDLALLSRAARRPELEPRHRALLDAVVDRHWPRTISAALVDRDRRLGALLEIGADLNLELSEARWLQLLDAYLSSPNGFRYAGDRVDWWLARQYRNALEPKLLARMPTAGAGGVRVLVGITGQQVSSALLDAAVQRLSMLIDDPGFSSAVGLLAERGADGKRMEPLLGLPLDEPSRLYLDSSLAKNGDVEAQLRMITRWTASPPPETNRDSGRPFWHPDGADSRMLPALSALIRSCASAGRRERLRWAAAGVANINSVEAARELDRLAEELPQHRWTLLSSSEGLRGRLATHRVLERLPASLGELTDSVLGPVG